MVTLEPEYQNRLFFVLARRFFGNYTLTAPMFAIVDIAGFQEKVEQGMTLQTPSVTGEKGKKLELAKVLLVVDGENVSFGAPHVSGAMVEAEIVDHGRGEKIRIQKFERRKRYRRVKGHRQGFSTIKINKITLS